MQGVDQVAAQSRTSRPEPYQNVTPRRPASRPVPWGCHSGQRTASDQRADGEAEQVLCDWSTGMTRRVPRPGCRAPGHLLVLLVLLCRRACPRRPDGRTLLAFEKMLTFANHVGLYSEEGALSGVQVGILSPAFTHLALMGAAIALDEALDRVASRMTGRACMRSGLAATSPHSPAGSRGR
jgi:hypothetical protein